MLGFFITLKELVVVVAGTYNFTTFRPIFLAYSAWSFVIVAVYTFPEVTSSCTEAIPLINWISDNILLPTFRLAVPLNLKGSDMLI